MITLETPAPMRLDANSNATQMTPEEFDAVADYDDCLHYELVNGVVIAEEIAEASVGAANDRLGYALRTYQHALPDGENSIETVYSHYVRTPSGRRLCHRAIWARLGRRPRYGRDVPTIVAEFLPQCDRDGRRFCVDRRIDFLSAGVREYWLCDRFRRTLTIFRPTSKPLVFHPDERWSTPLLPGFEFPLDDMLATADRFADC